MENIQRSCDSTYIPTKLKAAGKGGGSVWIACQDDDCDYVLKVVPFRNKWMETSFLKEVYAMKKLGPLKVCPQIYEAMICEKKSLEIHRSKRIIDHFLVDAYEIPDNQTPYIYGQFIMTRMGGDLKQFYEQHELTPKIAKKAKKQLKKKFKKMLKHNFIYTDVHEGNLLYKMDGDQINWFFGDMDIDTFDEYRVKAIKRRQKAIVAKDDWIPPEPNQARKDEIEYRLNAIDTVFDLALKGEFKGPGAEYYD